LGGSDWGQLRNIDSVTSRKSLAAHTKFPSQSTRDTISTGGCGIAQSMINAPPAARRRLMDELSRGCQQKSKKSGKRQFLSSVDQCALHGEVFSAKKSHPTLALFTVSARTASIGVAIMFPSSLRWQAIH